MIALAEPLNVRGNAVVIDHGGGVFSGYWHLSEIKVTPGQTIALGDIIGLSGNTGLSTGAHLHWELRIYGIAVDPLQFL
jgi:murein DD-endopeptidase MepM/ murein hydrolase activator NlpD